MAIDGLAHILARLGSAMASSGHGHADSKLWARHGDDHSAQASPETYPTTYFTSDTKQLFIWLHVGFMILSWVIILPIATMLSLAKNRHAQSARIGAMMFNIIGVFFGLIYKNSAEPLYPGSAHSAVGWIASGMVAVQVGHFLLKPAIELYQKIMGRDESKSVGYGLVLMRESFIGSRQGSLDEEANISTGMVYQDMSPGYNEPQESGFTSGDDTLDGESTPLHHGASVAISDKHIKPTLTRAQRIAGIIFDVLDRTILVVGFVAICTGIITFWGLFRGDAMLNGISHWIKGGVFFWLGLFNLGRWCGCFSQKGWAWNTRPGNSKRQTWLSFEFVESALIFFYGSTNIFLEHLSGWGKVWTARDLEHVAITVLFIGGGLCGMLVEYIRVKGLGFAEQKAKQQTQSTRTWSNETLQAAEKHTEPGLNGVSINPLPAMVIFLMGGMMASHQQASSTSTMVHKQWGNLLSAASFARLLTYVIIYMKPPYSTVPSRPPTELLAAFCFISGGLLFMASSRDTVDGMIHFGVDPMALYTVTMGFTGLLMAWVIALLAIKDRASR